MKDLNCSILIILLSLSSALFAEIQKVPSYECANAYYEVEKIICKSNELSHLDSKLATIYSRLLKLYPDQFDAIKTEQTAWIHQRNDCKKSRDKEQCIKELYQTRTAEIASKVGEKSFSLSDAAGLSNIHAQTTFSVESIQQHIPNNYHVKLNSFECETGNCNEITVEKEREKIAIIGEENGYVSYILVLDNAIDLGGRAKIHDLLTINDTQEYQSICSIGEEYYAGFILCKQPGDTHIKTIYKGDYAKADIELPPLEIAKTFKVFAVIWEK
jgi:uncharacterized protein